MRAKNLKPGKFHRCSVHGLLPGDRMEGYLWLDKDGDVVSGQSPHTTAEEANELAKPYDPCTKENIVECAYGCRLGRDAESVENTLQVRCGYCGEVYEDVGLAGDCCYDSAAFERRKRWIAEEKEKKASVSA